MSRGKSGIPVEADEEVAALIATLHETGRRLEELTAGEVDAVADRQGQTFVLRHAQEQLRQSEASRQAAILNALPAHVALLDARGLILSANEAWRRFATTSEIQGPGHAIGVNYLEVCASAQGDGSPDAREVADGLRSVLVGAEASFSIEYPCHSQTEQRWFLLTATPLADDRPSGAVVMQLDITERVRARRDLGATRNRLRHLVSESPAIIYALDIEGETLTLGSISENVERLLGYSMEEALAPDWWIDRLHPEDRDQVLADLAGLFAAGRLVQEYRFRHRDGAYRWFHDSKRVLLDVAGHPTEVVGSWSDATERKIAERKLLESEEALRQSQKMEAVGRLAGGVAHDFNNLLGVITGYSALLLKSLGPQHPGAKRVVEIQKAAERAAGLTRQLLAFSRKQVLQPRILDLNEVVSDVEKMLCRVIGEDIQLVTTLGAGLGRIRADPGQLQQVLMNLVVNARDAMPKGGEVVVATANAVLDKASADALPEVGPGPFVMLSVRDSGTGMDAETQSHMFEPFFTTKEEGKGTGLGLATVFGIVRQSGGSIGVDSEPGVGTTFRIYFPRVEGDPVRSSQALPDAAVARGTETVLLVEDSDSLRELIREILEGAGYAVVECSDPEGALRRLESLEGPVHLLFTDVVMPRMSGPDLAKAVRIARPDVKVLFMSGYSDAAVGSHGVLGVGTPFIQKPFGAEAMLKKIREALDDE